MKFKTTFLTGVLAVGTVFGGFYAKYHDYFNDSDIFKKIGFDLFNTPVMKKYSTNVHENKLYELLTSGSEEEFENELEKEKVLYKQKYNLDKCADNVELDSGFIRQNFEDYETLFSFLRSKKSFLRESLKSGACLFFVPHFFLL